MDKIKLKNDVILILVLIIIAVSLLLIFTFTRKNGDSVVVTQDGNEIARYYLNENFETDIVFENGEINHLVIYNGETYISYADCRDKICVSHRKISKDGEVIVCLPHKLVVSIESEN